MTNTILSVRIHAGFNAASFTAGLLALTDQTSGTAGAYLRHLFPKIEAGVDFRRTAIGSISGWTCAILTPPEHAHRHPGDIEAIYRESRLSDAARALASRVWAELIRAESRVHGVPESAVHFHEVGRMSNILAVGLCAEFMNTLSPARFTASPIPMNDGEVVCAHGVVPCPAPATFQMLEGVAVRPSAGTGELITPTGLAVLKGFGADFGPWPEMKVTAAANVFVPGKTFGSVPCGTRFLLGHALEKPEEP